MDKKREQNRLWRLPRRSFGLLGKLLGIDYGNYKYSEKCKRNNYDVEEDNNKNLNNYQKFYEKAKKEIAKKMRIEKIYKYLLLCNDENTIYELEKTINERRKI